MDKAGRESIKSAYLTWGDPLTDPASALGQLHFDVVISEEHERTAEVTSHTVEQGAAIVDHVRPNPDHLTLTVFVSNTPIFSDDAQVLPLTLELDPPGSGSFLEGGTSALLDKGLQAIGLQKGFPSSITAQVMQFTGEIDYVQNAYDALTRLRNTATLVNAVTPRQFYSNMVIERIAMTRDASTGTSANFEIELREIRIVQSSVVSAPLPTVVQATPMSNQGKKDPTPADGPKQSIARAIQLGKINLLPFPSLSP